MSSDSNLSDNAATIVDRAQKLANDAGLDDPGINQWVSSVRAGFAPILDRLVRSEDAKRRLADALEMEGKGEFGEPASVSCVVQASVAHAASRGAANAVVVDVIVAVLELAGIDAEPDSTEEANALPAQRGADSESAPILGDPGASRETGEGSPVRAKPTPTIDQFGRNLTDEATAGKLLPILGRDEQIQTLIEVLCRSTKRNPMLVGPPGSGKTAIAEGFAQRVASDEVPDILKGTRVLAIETSALMSGTGVVGSLEERVRKIIAEASQPDVVLFIDEAHTMMEAGGKSGGLADMLKPALARGELAVIAATTDDEYRRFIKGDGALERRFQPIQISEMTASDALEVLKSRRDHLGSLRQIAVSDEVLERLVSFADEMLRNRTFPDKALDLLEQCVAYAVSMQFDSVHDESVEEVLGRIGGVPHHPDQALAFLDEEIRLRGCDSEGALGKVRSRLQTTLRGLDVRHWRPNLVTVLVGEAADDTAQLAAMLARCLYADDSRVIDIDVTGMRDDESLSGLIGPPPGYLGYGRPLAIHALANTPHSVVVVRGLDVAHPIIGEVIVQGLRDGFISDTTGSRYYLSDAAVLISCPAGAERRAAPIGFMQSDGLLTSGADSRERVAAALGMNLAEQVDVFVDARLDLEGSAGSRSMATQVLDDVVARYSKKGIVLDCDSSIVEHLTARAMTITKKNDLERYTEDFICEALLPTVGGPATGAKRLTLLVRDDQAVVEEQSASS